MGQPRYIYGKTIGFLVSHIRHVVFSGRSSLTGRRDTDTLLVKRLECSSA
jgi:hypothetical protein